MLLLGPNNILKDLKELTKNFILVDSFCSRFKVLKPIQRRSAGLIWRFFAASAIKTKYFNFCFDVYSHAM